MQTKIQKWGNSQAIRLPKRILEAANLGENDQVEIKADKDSIVIRRVNKKHKILAERIAGYSDDYKCSEWDTGETCGNEVL